MLRCRALVAAHRRGHLSRRWFAEFVQRVPAMGDSIVEGTLSTWEKQVGDRVARDDVVATIETDKVSVEVRAEATGSIVALFAAVDDSVQVGADLLKLDTDAAAEQPLAAQEKAPQQQPATKAAEIPHAPRVRVPLIKFLGKRQRVPLAPLSSKPTPTAPPPAPVVQDVDPAAFLAFGAFYGRTPVTADEIDAVGSGGATLLDAN